MSESTIEAYKSASAGRRSSSVYGDAKALEKFRQTISTGFQTATETGECRCLDIFLVSVWLLSRWTKQPPDGSPTEQP